MKSIDIKNMTKIYMENTVHHEQISIHKRITILKGENGSGKSTLMKAILGLIHYQGSIEHRLECGYLPEKMTIPNHLKLITYLKLMLPIHRYPQMESLIDLFDMRAHLEKEIAMLSKGMHMKCRLIYTLSLLKDIYVLDEPFNGLDDESMDKLKGYIVKHEKMFLISTHLDLFERNYEIDIITL